MQQFFTDLFNQIRNILGEQLATIGLALLVLFLGYVMGKIVARAIYNGLHKAAWDNKIAAMLLGKEKADTVNIEKWVSRAVFYIIMLITLVGFFELLDLKLVAAPLQNLINEILEFIPNLIAALILLGIAWVIASILRRGVTAMIEKLNLDKLTKIDGEKEKRSLAYAVGQILFGITILLFLPAILETLGLTGPMGTVKDMTDKIVGFLPNLFAAGAILFVGWYVAKFVRDLITNLLVSIGADSFGEKIGLKKVIGSKGLSEIGGIVMHAVILVPVLIQTLAALKLESITTPADQMLVKFTTAIPSIVSAALILIIAYVVGKIVAGIVTNVLTSIGFNGLFQKLGLTKTPTEGERSLSSYVGIGVLAAVMIFAAMEAANQLQLTQLSAMTAAFLGFMGDVALGLVIIGLGLFLANLAHKVIDQSKVPHAALLAKIAWVAVIFIAGAMGLEHMGGQNGVVISAFNIILTTILGALGIAFAIAFGVGGIDYAKKKIQDVAAGWKKN